MLKHTLTNLLESWRRSVLCGVGVAIAAVAIVLLVSLGLGVQKDITGQVDDLGTGILVVVPGKVELSMGFNPNITGKSFLTDQSARDVSKVQGISKVAKFSFAGGYISHNGKDAFPFLIATSPAWFQINKLKVSEGHPFTDSNEKDNVCVIGSVAKQELFGDAPAVGKSVVINEKEYEIVAVTQESKADKSMFSAQSLSNVVYIPLAAVQQNEKNVQIDRIFAQVDPTIDPKSIIKDVEQNLLLTLNKNQFSVLTEEDLLSLIYQVMGILATLVIGLTSIALLVGGVGIMTVMLLSVGERTKEIGVRKALGASQADIFKQFLTEATVISLGGVVTGTLVSLVICQIIAATTVIKPLVTWQTILLTFAVGIGVGIVFGLIPAIRASRLNPVEALRLE